MVECPRYPDLPTKHIPKRGGWFYAYRNPSAHLHDDGNGEFSCPGVPWDSHSPTGTAGIEGGA